MRLITDSIVSSLVSVGIPGTDGEDGDPGIPLSLSLSSLTAGSILFAGPSGAIAQNNANLFWDDTNLRFGIGTVSPDSPLQVKITSAGLLTPLISARNLSATGDAIIGIDRAVNTYVAAIRLSKGEVDEWFAGELYDGGNADTSYSIGTSRSLGATTQVTIQANGLVGIGTTTPGYWLDIQRASGSFLNLYSNGAGGAVRLTVEDSATRRWDFGVSLVVAGDLSWRDVTSNKTVLHMQGATGLIGVGTTAPGQVIDAIGNRIQNQRFSANTLGPGLNTFKGRGTFAVPLRTQASDAIGVVNAFGYTAVDDVTTAVASTGTAKGLFSFFAAESFTTTGQGTYFTLGTTAIGATTATERIRIDSTGNTGFGVTVPNAIVHLTAGSATANSAPLKFNSGALLTTAEAGAVEFLTDKFYGTITTGAARKTFAFLESPSFVTPSADVLSLPNTGGAATSGQLTLVAGTKLVSTTAMTSTALLFVQRKTAGGTIGFATTYTQVNGTSFTLNSDNALDTSVYNWWIVETH